MNPNIPITTAESGRRGSLEQESEMIPSEPPAWVVRSVGWLLIAIFAAALVAAIVVRLPETVKCPFVLVPKNGADPVKVPLTSFIKEVRVTEAQVVAAGDELFVLRSDEIRSRHTQLQTANEDLRAKTESIAKMEVSHAAQLNIKDSEIEQVERELRFRKKHADTSRELVGRLSKLAAGGGISQIELARLQLDLAGSEKDLSITEKNLESVRLERERIVTERERLRSDEQAVVQNWKSKIAALHRDLENSDQDFLSIRAPYAAIVISLSHRTPGALVQAGEEICQLAHIEAVPHARLALGEQGLSRLATGQRVRLFFDAFPYQRYGTVAGRLDWISPAAIATGGGPQFIARTTLDQNSIRVKDEARLLRVGMKGEARIVVGSRAMIEYAFEPIRQLRENTQP